MKALWARLKNVMFFKVPGEYKAQFRLDSTDKNNFRFMVLPYFNILTQVACYVIYLYITPATYPQNVQLDPVFFTWFSLVYIALNLVAIFLFTRIRHRRTAANYVRRSQVMVFLFLVGYIVLEGFEAVIEAQISGNIYRFITTFFVVALLPILPRLEKLFFMVGYTAFVIVGFEALVRRGYATHNRYGEIALLFCIACAAAANITYSNTIKTFLLNQSLLASNQKLQEANEKLQYLAVTDTLTEIPNRRAFTDYINLVWDSGKRTKQRVTLLMIDIDHFKVYNDSNGHQKGDECLRAVAKDIQSHFKRSTDMVARYGGEEFVVLLPHIGPEEVYPMAELVRTGVLDLKILNHQSETSGYVTVSIGVAAMVPGINDSYEKLIKLADDALYTAKAEGRNRVCMAGDME